MNSSIPPDPWPRLVAAARRAPDDRDVTAPYGFATRVAALAMAQERVAISLMERFALRALGVACLLALVSVATNYTAINNVLAEDEGMAADDPVSELLEVAAATHG
jgi:hypothetical protein